MSKGLTRRRVLATASMSIAALGGCAGWDTALPRNVVHLSGLSWIVDGEDVGVSATICNEADMSNGWVCIEIIALNESGDDVSQRASWFPDDNECETRTVPFDSITPDDIPNYTLTGRIVNTGEKCGEVLDDV